MQPETETFHHSLFSAELHADTLLWDRDLLRRSAHGHVDLPRLQEGNVGLQVFGTVTRVPLFLRLDRNGDRPDAVKPIVCSQHWPESTSTPLGRALYQAEKLQDRVESSVGAMLDPEGAHALEDDLANLDRLYAAGFHILTLSHLFDNPFAGSARWKSKGGLTPLGKALVAAAEQKAMVIDLAHASPKAIEEALVIATRPMLASHGGLRGTCDSVRNLSDDQVRAIASHGGLIGIGLYRFATCGREIAAVPGGNLVRFLRAALP